MVPKSPDSAQTNKSGPKSLLNASFFPLLVKHCEKLTILKNQTILVPCFTSLGSTCYFGCRRGFFMDGDRQANCTLNPKGDGVSWKIGKFTCKGKFFTKVKLHYISFFSSKNRRVGFK